MVFCSFSCVQVHHHTTDSELIVSHQHVGKHPDGLCEAGCVHKEQCHHMHNEYRTSEHWPCGSQLKRKVHLEPRLLH